MYWRPGHADRRASGRSAGRLRSATPTATSAVGVGVRRVDDPRQLDERDDRRARRGSAPRRRSSRSPAACCRGSEPRPAPFLARNLIHRVDQRALDDHEHDRRDVEHDLVQRGGSRWRSASRPTSGVRSSPARRRQARTSARRARHGADGKRRARGASRLGVRLAGPRRRHSIQAPPVRAAPRRLEDGRARRSPRHWARADGRDVHTARRACWSAVSRAIRAAAWALVAAGVAAPVVRRRMQASAGCRARRAAALGARRAVRRAAASGARETSRVCALNMWAYLAAYEMPHDDPERLDAARPVGYPIVARPRARARRAADGAPAARFSTPGASTGFERVLVWCHWLWFVVPHASVAVRAGSAGPSDSPRAAARMYAVFDLGAAVLLGDPDRAAVVGGAHGHLGDGEPATRSAG